MREDVQAAADELVAQRKQELRASRMAMQRSPQVMQGKLRPVFSPMPSISSVSSLDNSLAAQEEKARRTMEATERRLRNLERLDNLVRGIDDAMMRYPQVNGDVPRAQTASIGAKCPSVGLSATEAVFSQLPGTRSIFDKLELKPARG